MAMTAEEAIRYLEKHLGIPFSIERNYGKKSYRICASSPPHPVLGVGDTWEEAITQAMDPTSIPVVPPSESPPGDDEN